MTFLDIAVPVASLIFFGSVLASGKLVSGCMSKASYILSTTHAILILLMTGYAIFFECADSDSVSCTFNAPYNSDTQQFVLLFSLGYFLVDCLVVLWLVPDMSAALHHTSIICGQIVAVTSGSIDWDESSSLFSSPGTSGHALMCFLFVAELSAPFLNAFLSGWTKEGSTLDFAARASFALVFIVSRLGVGPFLTYEFVLNSPNAHVIPKLVCLFVMGISVYWSQTIFAGIRAALLPSPATHSKAYASTTEEESVRFKQG